MVAVDAVQLMLVEAMSFGVERVELEAEALVRLRELDPSGSIGLVVKVVRAFEASAARHVPKLRVALDGADRPALLYHAHTLKTSAAYLGAMALSQRCAAVEKQAANGAHDALCALVGEIERLTDPTLRALRALPELVAS